MSTKIKLEEGCIDETLYIDDKIAKPNIEQLSQVLHKLVDKMVEVYPEDIYGYVACFTRQLGDVTDSYYCDQCANTTYTYELEV